MCGITGVLNLNDHPPVEATTLLQMLEMIRHRGPDGFGIYRDEHVGLGSARLSIIDLSGGDQPISNEDGTLWIVFNGEIFNYVELRPQLVARGHRFSTNTDTEVIVHLYEDYGPACLPYLNGQFALALWDARQRSLFLARDRLGVRPLFYTIDDGRLVFGSEIKALLAHPGITAEIDSLALNEIFTFWSTLSPRSIFQHIEAVPPAHYLLARNGEIKIQPYWTLDFAETEDTTRTPADYIAELESLLIDATRIRLRADVPVGAYLSGGLDSSTTTAIIRKYTNAPLDTFSIAFADNPEFDESHFQRQMAEHLGTDHHVVQCTHADIGRAFPDVIWHTETPMLRTAPVPMFLLSRLVHDLQFKVVVTGEGADEFLAGYDIFKEMQVRRFWAKRPSSEIRPLLFHKLYPDIVGLGGGSWAYVKAFFERGLTDTDSPYYSHALRWNNTARTRQFLLQPQDIPFDQIPLPSSFNRWSRLAQAQYLEIAVFLSQYLLSSQGDRPAMAHSVEGRFPFLDHRVVEFCNRLPAHLKLHGMTEKWLLKQVGRKLVPPEIWRRPKRPYRAPIHRSFFNANTPDYVNDLLSEESLRASGLFNVAAVRQLVRKASSGMRLSEVEDMAVAGVLSTQLVHRQFVKAFTLAPVRRRDHIKVVDRVTREDTWLASVSVHR
jgi:asparagine synthase (glutamine-hydrolysing)